MGDRRDNITSQHIIACINSVTQELEALRLSLEDREQQQRGPTDVHHRARAPDVAVEDRTTGSRSWEVGDVVVFRPRNTPGYSRERTTGIVCRVTRLSCYCGAHTDGGINTTIEFQVIRRKSTLLKVTAQ